MVITILRLKSNVWQFNGLQPCVIELVTQADIGIPIEGILQSQIDVRIRASQRFR